MRIYTLGTSELSEAEFSKILSKYQIHVVADIRLAGSTHPDHLKREDIQRLCQENKDEYIYLGNELAQPTGASFDATHYQRGISILKSLARTRGLLILGSMRSPERCIRRKIADELSKEGAEVVHLLDIETVWDGSFKQESRPKPRSGRPDSRHHGGRRGKGRRDSPRSSSGSKKEPPLHKKTGRSKMDKAL
ncbi:hypothetical protein JXM67_05685 [candidate division WOR-3 bacterium]|nr:hypothetical protein [candidate division WOR-3 bacterium]